MRGYQYPLTDTDVGQLAASDPERFHLGCRISLLSQTGTDRDVIQREE